MGEREGSMAKKPDEMARGQEDVAERKADRTGQTDRTVRVKKRQQSRNSRFVTDRKSVV